MVKPPRAIHPAEYERLNDSFYHAEPHQYLESRLWSLALLLNPSSHPQQARYEDFGLTVAPTTREQQDHYAALESTVLLHHVCESFLRLYLAHANRNPCPWVAISQLIHPREFKQRLTALADELSTDQVLDDIVEVFTGTSDRTLFPEVAAEAWADHRAALKLLAKEAIRVVLDDASLYNAAKHGLALIVGPVGLTLGGPEDRLINHHGPGLVVLESPADKHGQRHWNKTTHWVRPTRSMALAGVLIQQIEALWNIARIHYKQGQTSLTVIPLHADRITQLLEHGQRIGFNVSTMSERLWTTDDTEGPSDA